jgi:uncharacterized protein (DUF302 family)
MTDPFTAEHVEYASSRSFEAVIATFEAVTGDISGDHFERELAASKDVPDFERRIRSYEGDSGFMRFQTLDHGAWSALYGDPFKARLYILGNPLIARTMMQYDLRVGLNVPVRLLIYETAAGEVRLGYDLPSSLMSRLVNADVTAAARKLDAKLAALAERVTGAKE